MLQEENEEKEKDESSEEQESWFTTQSRMLVEHKKELKASLKFERTRKRLEKFA